MILNRKQRLYKRTNENSKIFIVLEPNNLDTSDPIQWLKIKTKEYSSDIAVFNANKIFKTIQYSVNKKAELSVE